MNSAHWPTISRDGQKRAVTDGLWGILTTPPSLGVQPLPTNVPRLMTPFPTLQPPVARQVYLGPFRSWMYPPSTKVKYVVERSTVPLKVTPDHSVAQPEIGNNRAPAGTPGSTSPTVKLLRPPGISAGSTISPGGKEEKTGAASALSDRLTMGSVEVISSDHVKLVRLNRPAMFCAPCPLGISVRSTLSSVRPAASLAVKVTTAVDVPEGLA